MTDLNLDGARVASGSNLDAQTAQTAGMSCAPGITAIRVDAWKLCADFVHIHPDVKKG
mgnify:CR=1 FL=1